MNDKSLFAAMFAEGSRLYANGRNVVEGLTARHPDRRAAAIEIAYSLQSGSYTTYADEPAAIASRREGHAIVEPFMARHGIRTVLDCGAGEGTRWFDFTAPVDRLYALDASYHRMAVCRRNLAGLSFAGEAVAIKGNMLALPFAPQSVDAVFSCHAIEPNRDADAAAIIDRMFAIARRLVVMLEPDYRGAGPDMRARMEHHGYARNIWAESEGQPGFDIVAEGVLEASVNPLNATSYRVFARREPAAQPPPWVLASPIDGARLTRSGDALIDALPCYGFPVVSGIACLAPEDAIFLGCDPDTPG